MTCGEFVGSWACLIDSLLIRRRLVSLRFEGHFGIFELRLGLSNVTVVSQRYNFLVVVVACLRPVLESVTRPANSV